MGYALMAGGLDRSKIGFGAASFGLVFCRVDAGVLSFINVFAS